MPYKKHYFTITLDDGKSYTKTPLEWSRTKGCPIKQPSTIKERILKLNKAHPDYDKDIYACVFQPVDSELVRNILEKHKNFWCPAINTVTVWPAPSC